MGDVLSQSEIDQLLNALNTGELDVDEYQNESNEKQIKEYDFARPSKFSKEHLRTLEIIFEHYSRLVSTALPAHLRTPCSIEVINSEAIAYSEFSNALSNPVILGIIDVDPLKNNFLLEVSVNIGYAIVDRLLGGKGDATGSDRDFSEIELAIIEKILNIFVDELAEPWKNVVEIRPRLEQIETNSQFAQIISPNETIALITLNVQLGKVDGLINICIPYLAIETIMEKLNTKYWYSAAREKDKEIYSDVIEKQIGITYVPLRGILGRSIITIEDFVELQKGDIIRLDRAIDKEIEVLVGNIEKFKGKVGMYNNKNAIMVTEIIRMEE